MKKIFLMTVVALALVFTGCGDSLEKLTDDAVVILTKCLNGVYTEEQCNQESLGLTERFEKLSREDQEKYNDVLGEKLRVEWDKKEEDGAKK